MSEQDASANSADAPGNANDGASDASDAGCDCKVGRGSRGYGLDGLDRRLVDRWTRPGDDGYSLRDLADYFNREVLRAAMADAGVEFLDGEVENTYRLLVGDDASSGMQAHARNRLERQGVDVDAVTGAFVSHQTVHTHLTDCLGASHDDGADDGDDDRRAATEARLRALQNRTVAVTADALDRLRDADDLALDEFDVFVDVSVLCRACGTQSDLGTLLDEGGCECRRDGDCQRDGD